MLSYYATYKMIKTFRQGYYRYLVESNKTAEADELIKIDRSAAVGIHIAVASMQASQEGATDDKGSSLLHEIPNYSAIQPFETFVEHVNKYQLQDRTEQSDRLQKLQRKKSTSTFSKDQEPVSLQKKSSMG